MLGFSLGGFIAQEVALLKPDLVRKLVLAGTGPQGGPQMHGWRKDVADAARKPDAGAAELLYIMFKLTPTSQAKGQSIWAGSWNARWTVTPQARWQPLRLNTTRSSNGAFPITASCSGLRRLSNRPSSPTATANPDSAHGFLWQHNREFGGDVNRFLSDRVRGPSRRRSDGLASHPNAVSTGQT